MIEGVVTPAYEAVVTFTLRGPAGRDQEVQVVIDTGYNGFLTLPPELVTQLGLRYRTRGRATLADGSSVELDVYDATVLWDGRARYIEIDEADTTPLVGMLLLDEHSLSIEVEVGGRVSIQAKQ